MTNHYLTIRELDKILSKAKMSPDLRKAVEAIRKAMENGNNELVADLTAVKSFIVFKIDPDNKNHHFQEDYEYNKKVLGFSLYEYLDSLNHKYAILTDTLPSGTMAFESGGIVEQKGPSKRKHPIIKLMEQERNEIEDENKRMINGD